MSDMGNLFPINTEFETIESALTFFDDTEKTYFEACDVYSAQEPEALALATVLLTAQKHINAFSESLTPLIYDTELGEFARISGNLIISKENARVNYLNSLLGKKVLKSSWEPMSKGFPDTPDAPHNQETIAAKMRIFDICKGTFATRVTDNTRLFLDTAHN